MRKEQVGSGYYDDMLELPHPESKKHPRMSVENRAAQFAPFAALTGYEDAIEEEGRLTGQKAELDENRKEMMDLVIRYIACHLDEKPEVTVWYFQSDEKKSGGAYISKKDWIKKIDEIEKKLVFADGTGVLFEDIYDISIE